LIIFRPTRKLLLRKVSKKYSQNKKQDYIDGEYEDKDDS